VLACAAALRIMNIFCPGVGAGGIFGGSGVVFYPHEVLSHSLFVDELRCPFLSIGCGY